MSVIALIDKTMTVNLNVNKENDEGSEAGIKELIEKNLELSDEILRLSKKTNSYMMWQNVFSTLKLFIIVIPIIIGFLYLPPIIKEAIRAYQEALGLTDGVEQGMDDLKSAPGELLDSFRK
jgi:hypothetical protein